MRQIGQNNATGGPRIGPDGEGVTVPQREGIVHQSHHQWLNAVYSKVYTTHSKVNELENQQIESYAKLTKQLNRAQETARQQGAMAPVV